MGVVLTPRIETNKKQKMLLPATFARQYKDGVTAGRPALPRPVTQTNTYRPVSVNKVTGAVNSWHGMPSEELCKSDSPAVTGFTPDKPSVPAQSVTLHLLTKTK